MEETIVLEVVFVVNVVEVLTVEVEELLDEIVDVEVETAVLDVVEGVVNDVTKLVVEVEEG